jgi:hypothetical protein
MIRSTVDQTPTGFTKTRSPLLKIAFAMTAHACFAAEHGALALNFREEHAFFPPVLARIC